MNNSKIVIVGVVLALVVSVVAVFATFTKSPQVVLQPVGSVVGPDITSPYLCVSGVCTWYYSSAARPAVNMCGFKSPNATTTVERATLQVLNIAGSTNTFEIGYSSTAGATTTRLAIGTAATGASTWIRTSATSTDDQTSKAVIAPNTYINFNLATGTIGTFTWPYASCKLELTGL